jgi:hypothetical protein
MVGGALGTEIEDYFTQANARTLVHAKLPTRNDAGVKIKVMSLLLKHCDRPFS